MEEQIIGNSYVLYWMQAAQRDNYNPALCVAIDKANELSLPLLILFCIDGSFPEANLRHYKFMLEGLWEVGLRLQERCIPLLFALGETEDIIIGLSQGSAAVIFDKGYLRWQKHSRENVRRQLHIQKIPCFEVETEAIIPVETVSPKEEYSAATLRAKLLKILPEYLDVDIPCSPVTHSAKNVMLPKSALENDIRYAAQMASAEELIAWARAGLAMDESVAPVNNFRGGYRLASEKLDSFVRETFPLYATLHSDPGTNYQSGLSPWLHFGQISALEIAHRIMVASDLKAFEIPDMIKRKAELTGIRHQCATFLEQLIVRRELSMNFCHYNQDYDSYNSIPLWARDSLEKHKKDRRPYLYS
ncbi:MAG: deoxyribodipyrimidine photo-lyase, partial [Candidatus Cloacimonas sp.]|nr:deoxyribodipyrimidine photo-lyase [Candidatus Cloacimonas sp.]